ncbi:unnamed protein product [Choristocarpus tenellus]
MSFVPSTSFCVSCSFLRVLRSSLFHCPRIACWCYSSSLHYFLPYLLLLLLNFLLFALSALVIYLAFHTHCTIIMLVVGDFMNPYDNYLCNVTVKFDACRTHTLAPAFYSF